MEQVKRYVLGAKEYLVKGKSQWYEVLDCGHLGDGPFTPAAIARAAAQQQRRG